MSHITLQKLRKIWSVTGNAVVGIYGSIVWGFCIVVEVIYPLNGVHVRIVPLIVLIAGTPAHWWLVARFAVSPHPWESRGALLHLDQAFWFLFFWLLLFQSSLPIW